MTELVNGLFLYLAIISYSIPIVFNLKIQKGLIHKNLPFFILILTNFFFVVLELIFSYRIQNCYPIYHVSVFVATILTFAYFIKSGLSPKIATIFLFLTVGIFFYETVYLNRFFYNNYILTVFSNVSISLISLLNLFKLFTNTQENIVDFKFHYYINTAFFVFNSSAFYVSLFESHIKAEDGFLLDIIYPIFSGLIVLQNLLITAGLWQLKKS
jgi:hypothetical protein